MRPLRHFSSLLALALPAFAAFKFDTEHDAHGDGGDSEWEPPHPSLILPEGQGWLETPEIKAFINSKYQCRRYEWAPTIQECRELLDQLPEDMPCMDRHVLFRPEDRITAAGGTGAGGCEIEIFDSDPDPKECWTRKEVIDIVEGMIRDCAYDDEFGTVYDDIRVMGTYFDKMQWKDDVHYKQLMVQPAGIPIFNQDRFLSFPRNRGIYTPLPSGVIQTTTLRHGDAPQPTVTTKTHAPKHTGGGYVFLQPKPGGQRGMEWVAPEEAIALHPEWASYLTVPTAVADVEEEEEEVTTMSMAAPKPTVHIHKRSILSNGTPVDSAALPVVALPADSASVQATTVTDTVLIPLAAAAVDPSKLDGPRIIELAVPGSLAGAHGEDYLNLAAGLDAVSAQPPSATAHHHKPAQWYPIPPLMVTPRYITRPTPLVEAASGIRKRSLSTSVPSEQPTIIVTKVDRFANLPPLRTAPPTNYAPITLDRFAAAAAAVESAQAKALGLSTPPAPAATVVPSSTETIPEKIPGAALAVYPFKYPKKGMAAVGYAPIITPPKYTDLFDLVSKGPYVPYETAPPHMGKVDEKIVKDGKVRLGVQMPEGYHSLFEAIRRGELTARNPPPPVTFKYTPTPTPAPAAEVSDSESDDYEPNGAMNLWGAQNINPEPTTLVTSTRIRRTRTFKSKTTSASATDTPLQKLKVGDLPPFNHQANVVKIAKKGAKRRPT